GGARKGASAAGARIPEADARGRGGRDGEAIRGEDDLADGRVEAVEESIAGYQPAVAVDPHPAGLSHGGRGVVGEPAGRRPGADVPERGGPVLARRHEAGAVRREGERDH